MAKQVVTGSESQVTWNLADWVAADVLLVKDTWTQVGYISGKAGIGYVIGAGSLRGQSNAEGRLYAELIDTAAAQVNGEIKFELEDAAGVRQQVLFEGDIVALKTSATDRGQMRPFPMQPNTARPVPAVQDQKIIMSIKCDDAAKTLDLSASTLIMDGTRVRVVG
jgi:hypothetical protein